MVKDLCSLRSLLSFSFTMHDTSAVRFPVVVEARRRIDHGHESQCLAVESRWSRIRRRLVAACFGLWPRTKTCRDRVWCATASRGLPRPTVIPVETCCLLRRLATSSRDLACPSGVCLGDARRGALGGGLRRHGTARRSAPQRAAPNFGMSSGMFRLAIALIGVACPAAAGKARMRPAMPH